MTLRENIVQSLQQTIANLSDDQLMDVTALVLGKTKGAKKTNGFGKRPSAGDAVKIRAKKTKSKSTKSATVSNEDVLALVQKHDRQAVSRGEVVEALGISPHQASRLLKELVEARSLKTAGDRRFCRYGLTKKLAKARSDADRNGG